jgi:ferrous iron transport protein A
MDKENEHKITNKDLIDRAITLADLNNDEAVQIVGLKGDDVSKRRLMALGIVRGKEISLETQAPMGDPRIYSILGYRLTIRNDDAQKILVTTL